MQNLQMFGTLVDDWLSISLGVGTKTGNFRNVQIYIQTHGYFTLYNTRDNLAHAASLDPPFPSPTLFIRRIHLRFMSIQFLLRPNLTTCQSRLSLYSSPRPQPGRTRNRGPQIDVYLCLAQIFIRKCLLLKPKKIQLTNVYKIKFFLTCMVR